MRLTRETLLKVARDTATQRARVSRRIICIYLTGSVLTENPMLGGTTDIDLVVIQDSDPMQPRELVKLSDEVHLDISYYSQAVFHHPRHLRTDPWLGPFIYSKPLVLHDTQHWFDFTQAATGAQFFQPDYVLQRASKLSETARQGWMDIAFNTDQTHPHKVGGFLNVLENAGNALASLVGDPITERRFLLLLPQRLQALHAPDLSSTLIKLIIPNPEALEPAWMSWQENWQAAYQAAGRQPGVAPQLQSFRQGYYKQAAEALWNENPGAATWLLLRSWTMAACHLPEGAPELAGWEKATELLLLDEAHFEERMQALDHYLDLVEETLEGWGRANGASNIPE